MIPAPNIALTPAAAPAAAAAAAAGHAGGRTGKHPGAAPPTVDGIATCLTAAVDTTGLTLRAHIQPPKG